MSHNSRRHLHLEKAREVKRQKMNLNEFEEVSIETSLINDPYIIDTSDESETGEYVEDIMKSEWVSFFEKSKESVDTKPVVPLRSPFLTGQAERTQRLHRAQNRQKALGCRKLTEFFSEFRRPTSVNFIESEPNFSNVSTGSIFNNEDINDKVNLIDELEDDNVSISLEDTSQNDVLSYINEEMELIDEYEENTGTDFDETPENLLSWIQKLEVQLEGIKKKGKYSESNSRLERLEAVLAYFRHRIRVPFKLHAGLNVAVDRGWSAFKAKSVVKWSKEWLITGDVSSSKRGTHVKTKSLITHEDIYNKIRAFLQSNKFTVTPLKLQSYVNTEILADVDSDLQKSISLRTASKWLQQCGFVCSEKKIGVYFDGHERPDVILYRQKFLNEMAEYERRMVYADEEDVSKLFFPLIPENSKYVVLVTHDESIFYSNDDTRLVWHPQNEMPLRKKGKGRSLMISDFLTETIGPLALDSEFRRRYPSVPAKAREQISPGKNNDGWWTIDHLIQQVETKAIPIFEAMHRNCVALFAFDHSTNHTAYAEDALVANSMNLDSGGAQKKMRDGFFNGNVQKMNFEDGTPKGMKIILQERGLWSNGLRKICRECKAEGPKSSSERTSCCARRILELQPDFSSQKSRLQEVIESHGHHVIFYPKFHCELNYIEMYWGAAKKYTRDNCDYSWRGLLDTVPKALDSIPLLTIRKFARKSFRYMNAYRLGLTGHAAEFAVRKYKSHRRVPLQALREFDPNFSFEN